MKLFATTPVSSLAKGLFCSHAGMGSSHLTSLAHLPAPASPTSLFQNESLPPLCLGRGTSSIGAWRPQLHIARSAPRAHPPIAIARPRGPFKGGAVNDLDLLGRHTFTFNRAVELQELARLTPRQHDRLDRLYYGFEKGVCSSKYNPRFVLADIDRVDSQGIIAMLALGRSLVMRRQVRNPDGTRGTMSTYLVADHTWALWGWTEAAFRGELDLQGNVLLHIDDHPDLSGFDRPALKAPLSIGTVDGIIEREVQMREDPSGIASFIAPAAKRGFINTLFWEYGTQQTAETKRLFDMRLSCLEDTFSDHHFPDGQAGLLSAFERIIPHTEFEEYRFPPEFTEAFPGWLLAFRSDAFPFEHLEAESHVRAGSPLIMDIDIDVQDEVEDVVDIVQQHLKRHGPPQCVTIAISPQFGSKLNHVQKVEGILRLLRHIP